MPVIIKNPFFSKKIKDATITPEKVLRGEIGYANNHTRVEGVHVCKRHVTKINLNKEEIIIASSLSKESVKTMTYQAQFKDVANNNNPESGLSISEKYSNTGLLVPLKDNAYASEYYIIKRQKIGAEYSRGTNLFVILDNQYPLYIYLGQPINDTYGEYMDPKSYTEKFMVSLFWEGNPPSIEIDSNAYRMPRTDFYMSVVNGVIDEIGIGFPVGGYATPVNQVKMVNHSICFGIEWI